jgi:hypothetical protein
MNDGIVVIMVIYAAMVLNLAIVRLIKEHRSKRR